jgi:hypothetical protein
MKMAIRKFHSPDVDDLAKWSPETPTDFAILLQVIGGPEQSPAEESFDILVGTPRALSQEIAENGPVMGRHHLFVETWDWPSIESFIRTYTNNIDGANWGEVAQLMGRLGQWEFEDYQPEVQQL